MPPTLHTGPVALAIDPGLATCGAAVLTATGEVVAAGALKNPPGEIRGAGYAPKMADRARRVVVAWIWLNGWWTWRPRVIVAEAAGSDGMKSGDAVASIHAGETLTALLASELGIPIAWVTPREWRRYFVPAPAPRSSKPKAPSKKQIAKHLRSGCALCREIGALDPRCAHAPRAKPARKLTNPMPTDAELYGAIGQGMADTIARLVGGTARAGDVHAVDAGAIGRWGIACSAVVRRQLGLAMESNV